MKNSAMNADKLGAILDYMVEHNEGHREENQKWLYSAQEYGNEHIVEALSRVLALSDEITRQIQRAKEHLNRRHGADAHGPAHDHAHAHAIPHRHIQYHQIGIIHTPHSPGASWSEIRSSNDRCSIILDEKYSEGLWKLNSFSHIIVLFAMDRDPKQAVLTVSPPWAGDVETGVFASRSPDRPNPIGLSVVALRGISHNVITTDNIDAYDETPLLDIKPYIEAVESRSGAGNGWIDGLDEALRTKVFRNPDG
jgi:tRNA-Thr(GGU) m(6)t(6)A37 methyltransferase TsaA